jgi:xylulokinase
MSKRIISYDLGTGGNKASLYDIDGACLASTFVPYATNYPHVGWHEQNPNDWWNAVVESTRQLLSISGENKNNIVCLGISGHSLGCVPIAEDGSLLRNSTPIWSDIRSQKEVTEFFQKVDPDYWYETTGNGFPAACYTIFKIMWYRNNEPGMYKKIFKIIGTKDYINLKLTGRINTDYSYASGTGVYNLQKWGYEDEFIKASGVLKELFPEIVPSTQILGGIIPDVAEQLGLNPNVQVVCGGVDNSCMALGAKNIKEGRVYTSLGSSAWIAVSSTKPIIDSKAKPFVFAHVMPGMFTSAVSIFSMGTSFKWVRDNICSDLIEKAKIDHLDVYDLMTKLAAEAPVGSNNLLFNPSLAGGTSQDYSIHIRGAYMGLDLKHGRADLIRAAMEGIAMNLRQRLDLLRKYVKIQDAVLLVGGGSKSALYRRIFADAYNTPVLKTNIDQDAGALGAAAIAAVGCGLWENFEKIDQIHKNVELVQPDPENNRVYEKLLTIFDQAAIYQANLSEQLYKLEL